MFFIVFFLNVTNLFILSYLFIDFIEYFLINIIVPYINIVNKVRNRNKFFEIKIFNDSTYIDIFNNTNIDINNRLNEINNYLNINLQMESEDSDIPDLIDIDQVDTIPNLIDNNDDINKQIDVILDSMFAQNTNEYIYEDTNDTETEDENDTEDQNNENIETNSDIIIIEKVE